MPLRLGKNEKNPDAQTDQPAHKLLPRKPEHPAGANFDRSVVKFQLKKEHEKWIRNRELQSVSASALH